jgi:hydrogenase maturation protease
MIPEKVKIKVIALGQTMRGDDAVGFHIINTWQRNYPLQANNPQVGVEVLELPGPNLISALENVRFTVIIDAIMTGQTAPGFVHIINPNLLSSFTSDTKTAHGFGVAESLLLAKKLIPPEDFPVIHIIAVEIAQVDLGADPSPEILAAAPQAAKILQEKIAFLLTS